MSCSPFDLRDYFLKELADPERKQVERHVRGCHTCREELDRLQITESALFSLREEEIPQRIAFVSDKIFEPSALRRAWAAFWGSSARLGFASAAMLSLALVVFASVTYKTQRPAPAPIAAVASPGSAISPAEMEKVIQAAVTKEVAANEARQEKVMEQRDKAMDQRISEVRQMVLWANSEQEFLQKSRLASLRPIYSQPLAENGDLK
jgi:hypothetical protein